MTEHRTVTMPVARGTRRARLQLTQVDPWSVLKTTFLYALGLLVVWVVAVTVLYIVLDVMGVFSSINSTLHDITGSSDSGGFQVSFSYLRVLGFSLVVGVVNVVLLTALATLGAFIYNLVADATGGIEVTLTEPE